MFDNDDVRSPAVAVEQLNVLIKTRNNKYLGMLPKDLLFPFESSPEQFSWSPFTLEEAPKIILVQVLICQNLYLVIFANNIKIKRTMTVVVTVHINEFFCDALIILISETFLSIRRGGGGGGEEEEAASRLDSPTMQADVLLTLPVDSPAGVQ